MFSVIILTHKTPTLLANCLESIRNTNGNKVLEVIIINDGGPDEIGEIAEKFKKSIHIKYIKSKHNRGISHSRNEGIKASKGKFITIFADNYTIHPDHFVIAEKHLVNYDTVASNIKTIGKGIGPATLNQYYQFVIKEWASLSTKTSEGYEGVNFPAGAASSFTREVIEDVGLFDTSLKSSEDTDYNRRLDEKLKKRLYADKLVVYRTETDGFLTTLRKQFKYGSTIFQFREKNKEQHFIKYEIKHAGYIIYKYLKTTKNIIFFPFIVMLHSALRMGIIIGILKSRHKIP